MPKLEIEEMFGIALLILLSLGVALFISFCTGTTTPPVWNADYSNGG